MPKKAKTLLEIAQTQTVPLEGQEQAWLFEWAANVSVVWPEVNLMFAVPNFSGDLSKAMRGKLKREGKKAGVPDIVLPVARGLWHGLFIEMKRQNSKPSELKKEQREWLDALNEQGYKAIRCNGYEDAKAAITSYLKGRRW